MCLFQRRGAPCLWATLSTSTHIARVLEVLHDSQCHVSVSSLVAVWYTVRPVVKVYARSVCGVLVRHDTRGVALLVWFFCPNSSQLPTAGDCSGNLILSELLQTLSTRLTCNLCLPVGECCREMRRNHNRQVWLRTIRIMAEFWFSLCRATGWWWQTRSWLEMRISRPLLFRWPFINECYFVKSLE